MRPREEKRQHVLQLIAEAVSAAWLIERPSRPDAAADVLVQQPAVDEHVERVVGGPHPDSVERVIPPRLHVLERHASAVGVSMVGYELTHVIDIASLAQEKDDGMGSAGLEYALHVQGRARVVARAEDTVE